jgi:PDZ domain-containing protein/carboxypeptidase family protein
MDDAGHAVTDFTVRLMPVSGGSLRSYPVLSPTGDFRLAVPPGTYEVSAVASGYGETGDRPRVEVQSGEAWVELALQSSAELSGRVVDAATRAPLAGAQVIVFRMPFGAGRWATLATDDNGAFHLSAAPKSGFVEVRKEGYAPVIAPVDRLPRGSDGRTIEVPLSAGNDDAPGTRPYEGVGLQLDFRSGVKVASVFEGGPAEQAGVLTGDFLLAADGQPLAGLSGQDVTQRIMGPSGTVVRLSVQRGDQTFDLFVRRRSIQF